MQITFPFFLIFSSLAVSYSAVIQKTGDIEESSTSSVSVKAPENENVQRVRRQYGYGNYYGNSGYGAYGGYGYPSSSYGSYYYPYSNGIFPLPGGYYPGSIVGSGSMWAAGGGLVGNILSFLVG